MSIPDSERSNSATITQALNGALADSFALYLKTKNFHWHVSGPHFRDYHLLFDEQATALLSITDEMAERVRKIGGTTLRSIGDIARRQTLPDNDRPDLSPAEMLAELRFDNLMLIERFRDVRRAAEARGDTTTSALTDSWIDQGETRAWVLLESGRSDPEPAFRGPLDLELVDLL